MNPTTLAATVRRFPLLGRPQPSCPSLPERVQEIAGIARAVGHDGTHAAWILAQHAPAPYHACWLSKLLRGITELHALGAYIRLTVIVGGVGVTVRSSRQASYVQRRGPIASELGTKSR